MPDLGTPLRLLAPIIVVVLTASACGGGGSSQMLPTIAPTTGAFYLLLDLETELDSMQVVERLIREFKVAAIPGSVFGLPDCHIRIAYGALQQETASAGMARLVEGLHHIIKG